jgi:hypothetical protein
MSNVIAETRTNVGPLNLTYVAIGRNVNLTQAKSAALVKVCNYAGTAVVLHLYTFNSCNNNLSNYFCLGLV